MRRVAAITTMIAALALQGLAMPALAQRGVARGGGFSGAGVSAPRSFVARPGGFVSHGPIGMRPTPAPRGFGAGGPIGMRPGAPRTFNYSGAPVRFGSTYNPTARMPYNRLGADHSHGPGHGPGHHPGDGDHHHHRGVYYGGYVYPYYPWFYTGPIFTGYVDPWLFGPDSYDYNNGYGYGGDVPAPYKDYGAQSSQPYPAEYYEGNPALPAQDSGSREPYAGRDEPAASSSAASSVATTAAVGEHAVTVIFNDGRPPVTIHNYLLTGSTLTVLDPQYREIPLDKINVTATELTNRAAGVDFRVPVKR